MESESESISVVLSKRQFCPSGDIWQCLEKFLIVTNGGGGDRGGGGTLPGSRNAQDSTPQ